MMLNIILRKLPSHHREIYVMVDILTFMSRMIDFDDLNLKMSLILAILIFMSNFNFVLS